MRLAQRTYIDRDGKATTDRRKGVRLLGPVGMIVDDEVAESMGLKQKGKTADKMAEKPRNKARPLTMPVAKA